MHALAHGILVRAMSVALRFTRLSGWVVAGLRRFPSLYVRLYNVFRAGSATQLPKRLIAPDLTPATRDVLQALRPHLEAAEAGRG